MYSRSTNPRPIREEELRVPKNYRGNAFSFDTPKYEPPVERESDVVLRQKDSFAEVPQQKEAQEENDRKLPEKEEKGESSLLGFSFEDLLIIALILILSQSGADDDILLLLALVLAYGK